MHEESGEAMLDEALKAFEQTQESEAFHMDALLENPTSPTLAALDENRRPSLKTVCETCPNSVWFSSPQEVKCYCRVMYLITWSTKEPNQMTHCDGVFLGQE